ncbi:MAG: 50S ribosomal protein L11 methyltransferase [Deltaproteobacteria bacterium]|jgi:ribosomal protein L11 methyltransferase|nr:50S ribosomal protein L11 methyltransferase [Deltaproteobacteria bacterium]
MPESKSYHRTARIWEKIVVETDSRMTEAIAAYLAALSGSGVEISTVQDDRINIKNGPVSSEKIIAYRLLDSPENDRNENPEITAGLREFLERLSHIFPDCPPPRFRTDMLEEEDWGKIWKSFFRTFQVTPTLTIKPSWEEDSQAGADDLDNLVIEMDPGLAFGTGHHASTQLALLLLEQLFLENDVQSFTEILDVGTGSGILAMGCALFGGENILAVDNDPDAVEAAAANVKRNLLNDKIMVSAQDVVSLQSGFDLIVANITRDTLTDMADTLTGLLNPGGYLVLSGIMKGDQENSIREVYTGKGLNFIQSITRDEWAALLLQKIN